MLVLFLFIIIYFTSEIEINIKKLNLTLNEISKEAFWENLKYDLKINLKVLYIPIDITRIATKIIKKRKNIKAKTTIISYIKKLNINHSETNLKIEFGLGDIFMTSLIIPGITTVVLNVLGKNGKPEITIIPLYTEKFNLVVNLKSNLKCRLYRFVIIFLKDRKNNRENI